MPESGLTAAAGASLVAPTMKSTACARGRRPASLAILALLGCAFALRLGCMIAPVRTANAEGPPRAARIFVLIVWDGLRPDFVSAAHTPSLFAMENEGVRFAQHHSVYPTITMVNAASIATGAFPGGTMILGDQIFLGPRLRAQKITPPPAAWWAHQPVNLENSATLAALNGPTFFNGALFGSESLGQQLRRAGGYLAVVGKKGPTFTFDDSLSGDPAMGAPIAANNFLFVSDDLVAPPSLAGQLAPAPPRSKTASVIDGARDAYFAQIVIGRALPAAKAAALGGHPALVVFWQHNPDLTQHRRGLGTQADFDALKLSDDNLARIRAAIAKLDIANRTDLMVVSDHGFATIRALVPLAQLLVAQGIKKSAASDDVAVAANGGTDLLYLSREAFPTTQARRAVLQKITDFVESQRWSGPLFTRSAAQESALDSPAAGSALPIESHGEDNFGWIKGTFSLDTLGLIGRHSYLDAPDLVVSFRELPEADNRGLTGPGAPSYIVDGHGEHAEQSGAASNRSDALVAPVKGVMYADIGERGGFATGLGMHAAAGARELHSFCAALGPDFRRHFVDQLPSGNLDLRATIARAMGLPAADQAGLGGRALDEALSGHQLEAETRQSRLTVSRALPATEAETILDFSVLSAGPRRWSYLDGVEYLERPLTNSKRRAPGRRPARPDPRRAG